MTDIELAYRKAEIRKAWPPVTGMLNNINFYAHELLEKLIADLMATGMTYDNALEVAIA